MRRFASQLFAQLFSIPLILFLCYDAQCQRPINSSSPIKPRATRHATQNTDWTFGEMRAEANPQYELLAQLSVRADYRKLQLVNIQLLKRMVGRSAKHGDDKEIRSNLAEIKKLATRLRTSFAIPKVESDGDSLSHEADLTAGILLLDKTITSFVENPLFQKPKVVNAELAIQAGKDISEIVRLSEVLRKLTKKQAN